MEEVVSEAEMVSEIMLPVSEEETASEEAASREMVSEEETVSEEITSRKITLAAEMISEETASREITSEEEMASEEAARKTHRQVETVDLISVVPEAMAMTETFSDLLRRRRCYGAKKV